MSEEYQQPAQTVLEWLHHNLPGRALAPLTGSDTRALRASVQIMEQYGYDRDSSVLAAFGCVVSRMQKSTRELAYHAIAHPLDWSDRPKLWLAAGLAPFKPYYTCSFEPGGSRIDWAEEEERRVSDESERR